MARNVEIKARVADPEALVARVRTVATEGPTQLRQDDTFFRCPSGRLKLRVFEDGTGELIFYRREDRFATKESFYVRTPAAEPDTLREALSLAYGQAGRITKRRTLYRVGRTRVHIDQVDKLGSFMELEVVLGEDEPMEVGVAEAEQLVAVLGIDPTSLVDCAYLDLLAEPEAC